MEAVHIAVVVGGGLIGKGHAPPARRFPYTPPQTKTSPTCGKLQNGMIYGETNLPRRLLRS